MGPPSTGVGVGAGVGRMTGIAIGDCEGAGVGSLGFVGIASLSAWQPLMPAAKRTTQAMRLAPAQSRPCTMPTSYKT